jgi:hypothetical protein
MEMEFFRIGLLGFLSRLGVNQYDCFA